MWDAWRAGDRAAATEAIPDDVVDQLIVHGSPADCRAHLARYAENGVTTTAPMILGSLDDTRRMIRELAPGRGLTLVYDARRRRSPTASSSGAPSRRTTTSRSRSSVDPAASP